MRRELSLSVSSSLTYSFRLPPQGALPARRGWTLPRGIARRVAFIAFFMADILPYLLSLDTAFYGNSTNGAADLKSLIKSQGAVPVSPDNKRIDSPEVCQFDLAWSRKPFPLKPPNHAQSAFLSCRHSPNILSPPPQRPVQKSFVQRVSWGVPFDLRFFDRINRIDRMMLFPQRQQNLE